MVTLPAHLAQVRDLPVRKDLDIGLCPVHETGDAGRGEQSVVFGLERGELFAANVRATTRHHHGGVPPEQRKRASKSMESLELLLELFVWGS
jgi:hypothetical protein